MKIELTGQHATILGGAGTIGLAVAEAFAQAGADVTLWDQAAAVSAVAAELAGRVATRVKGFVVDATDEAAVRQRAAALPAANCHNVICAAAVGSGMFGKPFWRLQPSDWRRVLEVNILGTVHAAHAMADLLIETQGTLLFLSSVAGQIGSPTDPPYSASKAALINFAQCAARDFARHGVRVNTICPGMVKTPLNQRVWQSWQDADPDSHDSDYDTWAEEKIRQVTPLNRWQTPEDMAALALFLASPLARNITGQTLNVDGGQVMHW